MSKKFLLLLFIFFYFVVGLAQESFTDKIDQKNEVTLLVTQIRDLEDLNLFTYFILNNNDYVHYYTPKQYSAKSHLYKVIITSSVEDFVDFLSQPKVGFFLLRGLVNLNTIEVSFQRTAVISSNYLTFFEGSKLSEGIEFFFDSSTDYQLWQPDMLETEKNNNFVSNNPIQTRVKIFGTLSRKKDQDFYSLRTSEQTNLKINIIALSQAQYFIKIYDDKFALVQQFLLRKNQSEYSLVLRKLSNNKLIYIEMTSGTHQRSSQRNKVFNLSYIFSIL